MLHVHRVVAVLWAATAAAQDPTFPHDLPRSPAFARVLHHDTDPERPGAVGNGWKAAFGRDGFCYVPFFGSAAERDYPLRTQLAEVRVGGSHLAFAADIAAVRTGDRYVYDRGAVREYYDLTREHVEQTIVVPHAPPGDVTVVLAIDSELREDTARPGIQFANALGSVGYGDAFLLRDGRRLPIETTFADGRITLHVPAALRDDGPVVIDPIYYTQPTNPGFPTPSGWPDLAFDVTHESWLVVWEVPWSITDFDLYSQMFDRHGIAIPGSERTIDATTASCRHPRVANHNQSNTFLVVCDRSDPQTASGRTQVWHALRAASPGGAMGPLVQTSSPTATGPAFAADVGGDSGSTNGGPFAVVWLQTGPGANTLHLRYVASNGQPWSGTATQVLSWGSPFSNLRISKTNGRDRLAAPMWLAVFSVQMAGQVHDTAALPISPVAGAGQPDTIESAPADDRNPSVTIPFASPSGATWFAVTSERQNPRQPRVTIYEPATRTIVQRSDLGSIGIGPYWLRLQTDGLRFVCTSSPNAVTIEASTLVFDGVTKVWSRQDGPHPLPGAPSNPSIASIAGSGGGLIDYGIAYIDGNLAGGRTVLTRFNGHADGMLLSAAGTGCQGLLLEWANLPYLGNTVSFPLSNYGSDLPCLALGEPTANPLPLCGPCQIGLRLDVPFALYPGLAQLDVTIPPLVDLVGVTFGVQGLAIGSGTCLDALRFSDTWWMTIR
ncbi:MAG: hypothetical protein JNL08_03860 [Planctomycetes bacterium]|nr:hypothetical protein [Planctomycetota bacterium]